jgi:hypothetical protein
MREFMKNTRKLFSLVILVFLMSACEEKTKDVAYYYEHTEERKQKLEECHNNPGEKSKTPNCINSSRAEFSSMFKSDKMPKVK